jgi:transcription elongation factor GreA
MEARISELTDIIGRAHVIDPTSLPHSRVSFGSKVYLIDQDDDSEVCYTIVGSQESDPQKGLISISSPMGKALIGKEEGDEVEINLPSGKKVFDIEEITCMDIIDD